MKALTHVCQQLITCDETVRVGCLELAEDEPDAILLIKPLPQLQAGQKELQQAAKSKRLFSQYHKGVQSASMHAKAVEVIHEYPLTLSSPK